MPLDAVKQAASGALLWAPVYESNCMVIQL